MKKNNLVTMGVSFLLCVGMVGAGFASWVISADVNEELGSTVKVEEVIDQRLQLVTSTKNAEVSTEKWDADLYFGAPNLTDRTSLPEGITENKGWLTNDGSEYEDLDVYIDATFYLDNLYSLYKESQMTNITLEFVLDKLGDEEGAKKVLADVLTSENIFGKSLVNEPLVVEIADKDEQGVEFSTSDETDPVQLVNFNDDNAVAIDGLNVTISIEKLLNKVAISVSSLGKALSSFEEADWDTFAQECSDGDTTFRYIFKFTYTWGDLFKDTSKNENSVNPFYFFNSYNNSDLYGKFMVDGKEKPFTYADVALEALKTLANVNAEKTENNYKIGLTAKVSKAQAQP